MVSLPRRVTADAIGGLLLVGAAAVLVATPYDGGSCTNVVAAYGLPAASLPDAEPPTASPALAEAHDAVIAAGADVTQLESEQAAVDDLYVAAEEARTAADEAQDDLWQSPYTDYSSDSYPE